MSEFAKETAMKYLKKHDDPAFCKKHRAFAGCKAGDARRREELDISPLRDTRFFALEHKWLWCSNAIA